jgi:hypothetical protein
MTWAYIAGFWDGEGSLLHPKRNGTTSGWRWRLAQNSPEVLRCIQSFLAEFGIKATVNTYKRTSAGNPTYYLEVARKEEIYKIVMKTREYSIVKQNCIIQFLKWFEDTRDTKLPLRHCHGFSTFILDLHRNGLGRNKLSKLTGITQGRIRQLMLDDIAGLVVSCKDIKWSE